jgi:uncharacterized protein YjbI with pentapeptide repeats
MGKCSYRWIEWDQEENRIVEKHCQNEIWEGSSEYCIFHDSSPKKDVELFKEKLDEQIQYETEKHNFKGYSFPGNWDFSDQEFEFEIDATFEKASFQNAYFGGAKFRANIDFSEAIFQGTSDFEGGIFQDADFSEAIFQDADFSRATFQDADFTGAIFQDADFTGAIFQGTADFNGTTFQGSTTFYKATFQGTAHFNGATFQDADFTDAIFQDADFTGATFHKKVEMVSKNIEKLDLRYTEFLSKSYITANLSKTLFHRADLEKISFTDCMWPKKIYEEVNMEEIDLSFKELETIYRDLKQNMQQHGDYSEAGEFYYREMEMRKKSIRKKRISLDYLKSFGYSLLKYTCGYGEKPGWVVRNSLIIILLGAVLFFFCGVARVGADIPPESSPDIIDYSINSLDFSWNMIPDFYYCFYYSVVTFTTLGYGDIHPVGYYSHAIAFSEAFIGAFFMALFVVVFARKMMR